MSWSEKLAQTAMTTPDHLLRNLREKDQCTHRSKVNGFCLAPRCMCGQQDIRNSINNGEAGRD